MIERLSPTARNIALVALFLLIGWFLWSVRSVLNPLILGYLLAFVAHPLVLRLEKRGWKRRRAVNFIFGAALVLMTLVAAGVYFQGRGLARELVSDQGLGLKVRERIEQAAEQYHDEISWVIQYLPKPANESKGEAKVETRNGAKTPDPNANFDSMTGAAIDPKTGGSVDLKSGEALAVEPGDKAADLKRKIRVWWTSWISDDSSTQAADIGTKIGSGAVFVFQQVFGNLLAVGTLLILLPIYTYFLLFELERIHRFVARYLPRRDRDRLVRIGTQIGEVLANFFRGRLLVCLAKGTFLALGLFIADVDFALLLGLGTGFLSLIPFVGSAIGLVMALLVAMLEHSLGYAVIGVGTVFLLAEGLENYFLIPKILGNSLGLHPVVVIFSLMAGAASMGMFGLLVALPLTATLVILGREFLLPVLADLADNDRAQQKNV
ncbi:MAG: AI-2E family transporter [Planctomycetota bacterium]|nr:AI-2E family transporter [Planctomycetota bacterium]